MDPARAPLVSWHGRDRADDRAGHIADEGARAIGGESALLAELAALGPYFAVDAREPGSPMPDGWQPLASLAGPPGALSAAIGQVRERLAAAGSVPPADIDVRVAASVTQLGLCARLIAPVLGAAVLGGGLRADLGEAWWAPPPGGPFGLSLPLTAVGGAGADGGADAGGGDGERACLAVLAGPVSALTVATASMSVSAQVLWGNVASAVNGAAAMIATARPGLAPAAAAAAGAMLTFPALAGSYQGRVATAGFRRRSCCLIYQLAPPGAADYCGDCVLAPSA